MKDLINKVRQWGLDRGIVYTGKDGQDKLEMMEAQARYTLKETAELLDAYAVRDITALKDAVGDVLVTLIVGASSDTPILNDITEWAEGWSFDEAPKSDDTEAEYGLQAIVSSVLRLVRRNTRESMDYVYPILTLNVLLEGVYKEFGTPLSLKYCLEHAYNEIKDRTGKVVDGQFIKDE